MKAYPHTKHFSDYHDNDNMNGMDLRDYFASHALIGQQFQSKPYNTMTGVAEECYRMADAMMKAREAK